MKRYTLFYWKALCLNTLFGWRSLCLFVPFMRPLIGMPTLLLAIRHAESDRNALLDGNLFVTDPNLLEGVVGDHLIHTTTKGKLHAANTGPELILRFGRPDVIIHSGYTRTAETNEALLSREGGSQSFDVRVDLNLREREGGYTHIMAKNETELHFPYLQKFWSVAGPALARPVGGESLIDVVENRLRWVIEKIWRRDSGKKIWFVTHGRTIQCLRYMFDDMSLEQFENFLQEEGNVPRNCSAMVYRYDPWTGKLKLQDYNLVVWA